MKKLFVLSFASILLLTGCGATDTLSCSYSNNADNGTTRVTYDIDHEEDEIKKVRITYKYDFSANNGTNNGTNNARMAGDNNNNGTNTNDGNNMTTRNGMNNGTNDNTGTDVTTGTTNGTNTNGTTTNGTNGTNGTNTNANMNGTNGNTGTNNNGITGYNANNNDTDAHTDGVGTGTDGTTNDTHRDDDGVVDGVVGSAIDAIVGTVTSIILDSAGLRDRHATVQNTYGNVTGFSVQNTNDTNDNYTVTYVIDYDTISDADLNTFNLSRDLDQMRNTYVNQGFTCK